MRDKTISYLGLYFNGRKLALHARGCAFESHQIHHTGLAQAVEHVDGNHEAAVQIRYLGNYS